MTRYLKDNKRVNYTFVYYLLILYLLFARDSMMFALNASLWVMEYAKYSVPVALILLLFYYMLSTSSRIDIKTVLLALGIAIVLGFGLMINDESAQSYLLRFSSIILGLVLAELLDFEISLDVYIKTMKFIAIISIIGFFLSEMIISYSLFPIIYTSTRGEAFTTLLFTNIPHLPHLQARNWGPFWEPGVYQAFLVVAVIFSLWNRQDKVKTIDLCIFILAILTTKSTTGYSVLPIIFLAYLFENDSKNRRSKGKYAILIMISLSYIFAITRPEISSQVFGKLDTFEQNSRWLSTIYGLKVWSENLMFGIGPSNIQGKIINLHELGGHISVTNTWIASFASYGVFLGALYLISYFQMIRSIVKTRLAVLVMCLVFLMLLSGENLGGSLFFSYLMFVRPKRKGRFSREAGNER